MTDTHRRDAERGPTTWLRKAFALVLGLIAVYLVIAGAWLGILGGSLAYLLIGVAYLASAVLFWRQRPLGGWLLIATFLGTVLWAWAECGADFWPLFSRVLLPAGLCMVGSALLFLMSPREPMPPRMLALATSVASAAILVSMFAAAFYPHGVIASTDASYHLAKGDNSPSDWSAYGRTTAGTRFSPFDQIDRANVSKLDVAWTYHTGDKGPGVDQNTPIQIGGLVYSCSPNDHIAALDADTGEVRWTYWSGATSPIWQRCRSLSYFDTGEPAGTFCAKRILNTTIDARLIALDSISGKPCTSFGKDGTVDLKVGQGSVHPGFYFQTSGPLVARDKVVIGGWVVDNQIRGEPSGVIRAFDARTGELSWAWDLGNPATTKLPPQGEVYTPGTPNMWTHAAYDDRLGLVYAPLGNETPDYYGPGRNPHTADYNSALVALDVETGRERWRAQTVHHDLWDYDLPSQPALVDLPDGKGGVDHAVLQATKRGQLFLFDRATGAPLSKVAEKPVPTRGAVPEEPLSPTQPFSVDMPVIGDEQLTERHAWGMTLLDQLVCRIQFKEMRYDGDFTPIGLGWSIEQPSNVGGMNWGSVAVDPSNSYAYVVDIRTPGAYKLVNREDFTKEAAKYPQVVDGHGPSPQIGTPYGVITNLWLSLLGVPCSQPPFGTISAVDLKTKKIAWQIPAGTSEDTGPLGIVTHLKMPIGLPAYAGTSATAGGLVFFAGTQDYYLRAYDAQTGQELWKYRLPVGSSATPMTYVSPKSGREFVLLSVGGAAHSDTVGDYVIAFALPQT